MGKNGIGALLKQIKDLYLIWLAILVFVLFVVKRPAGVSLFEVVTNIIGWVITISLVMLQLKKNREDQLRLWKEQYVTEFKFEKYKAINQEMNNFTIILSQIMRTSNTFLDEFCHHIEPLCVKFRGVDPSTPHNHFMTKVRYFRDSYLGSLKDISRVLDENSIHLWDIIQSYELTMLNYSNFIIITFWYLLQAREKLDKLKSSLSRFDSGSVIKKTFDYEQLKKQGIQLQKDVQQMIICMEDLKEILMRDSFDGLFETGKGTNVETLEGFCSLQDLTEENIELAREQLEVCRGYQNDPLCFRILHSALFKTRE